MKKNKARVGMRILLLSVSLIWAIPLLWSVVTALKPASECMLLNRPARLTMENFKVVFVSSLVRSGIK